MNTTTTQRRVRYEVLPTTREDRKMVNARWKVTRDGEAISWHALKYGEGGALELAVTTARCAWQTQGQLATLKIKGRHGRIIDERTYGRDPIRTKG